MPNIYRDADKNSWYDAVAVAYDRARPRYSAKILARMQQEVRLGFDTSVLEIGAGVGIATVELAQFGSSVVCLEPSKSACAIAKAKFAADSKIEIVHTTFEEWSLEDRFDVVVAATSFHWLDPEVRHAKTAAALKDGGHLVLLWNTPPQPSYEVHQTLLDVYQSHAPKLAKYEDPRQHQQNMGKIAQKAIASGYFQDLITEAEIVSVSYTVDEYLTLLSTLSPYIRLEENQRSLLFQELKVVLERSRNSQNKLDLTYLSLLQIAHKH